ncbi:hypothetical protein OAF83_01780 [Rubripirellula sp.]|nr:hypothetical protein [Rubripirellula sp.]MDB4749611.1 hypothetical protein [Rubripirellula sp.]
MNQSTTNQKRYDMVHAPNIKPHLLNGIPLFLALATVIGCNAKVEVGSAANPGDQENDVLRSPQTWAQ